MLQDCSLSHVGEFSRIVPSHFYPQAPVLQGHGHRALQCPLKEAVPKATSRRHFQARAFSPRSGPVGFTIATIFNYRHARPEVFVPFGNRRYWMGADRYGDGSASTELRCSEQTTIARVVGRRQSSMPPTWRIMTAPVTSPRLGRFHVLSARSRWARSTYSEVFGGFFSTIRHDFVAHFRAFSQIA